MTDQPHSAPFTVEIQQQFDPTAQAWQQQVFIKLYTGALASGFLGAISDRDWKTLCVIALHMDARGRCYPSRDHIARALGVDASTASRRIQSLLDFRWHGEPMVRAYRLRGADGRLGRQVYTILPNAPMGFGPPSLPPSGTVATEGPAPANAPNDPDFGGAGESQPGGDSATWQDRHLDQVTIFHLGKSSPLQTRSISKQDQRLKDLRTPETDPTTPSESSDLTASPCDVPPSIVARSVDAQTPAIQPPTNPLLTANEMRRDEHSPRMEPSMPKENRSQPSPVRPAKHLVDGFQRRLKARGVTVFPRDWHLKAHASAKRLLASVSMDEAEALVDWALAHPFWGTKISDLHRVVALAPEWQQERQRLLTGQSDAPASVPSRTETVPDRNMALLRRLYATATPAQETMPNGST